MNIKIIGVVIVIQYRQEMIVCWNEEVGVER
jgi:hypothetical protein